MSGLYSKASIREWREKQKQSLSNETAVSSLRNQAQTSQPSSPKMSNLSTKRTQPEKPRHTSAPKRKRYTQSVLDVGQRGVDWTTCAKCGMQYVGGALADVQQHRTSCKKLVERATKGPAALNFALWEDVYSDVESGGLATLSDGSRVIGVRQGSRKNFRRVEAIDAHVCEVLGALSEDLRTLRGKWMALFYVHRKSRRVTAYALVQLIKGGRLARVDNEGRAVLLAGTPPVQEVMVGVRRVWAAKEYRRQGHTTMLVETASQCLLSESVLSPTAVGFTTPTQVGASFAVRYCRRKGNVHAISRAGESGDIVIFLDKDVLL